MSDYEYRPGRIKDQIILYDAFGRVLLKVDAWIFQTAAARGDLQRWGIA